MIGVDSLDRLYRGYGFEARQPDEAIRVYIKHFGYFQNAEIVPLTDDAPVDAVLADLQASGFSCKVSRFESVEEAERKLFLGFFQHEATSARLRREYQEFCTQRSRSLGSEYEYIQAPHDIEPRSVQCSRHLVATLLDVLRMDGPVLVFLEAAAGFGKTCTAFEVMNAFLTLDSPVNSILAELQRNRQARIFRYVLLDEMDRNYRSCGLTSAMVEREIKSGRIPLIVDGFDELLHKDRDGEVKGQFTEVELMLETLATMLERKTKLFVTTRRTAVLGEQFDEWLEERRRAGISVFRITLHAPRLEDWIGKERRRRLESGGVPIHDLANPVLLTFLKNCDDGSFDGICADPSLLVDRYFEVLLDRERERQQLPLSPERQIDVLKTVARTLLDSGTSGIDRDILKMAILHEHSTLLKEAIRSSPGLAAKSVEELADKLSDHAVLDRKRLPHDSIGFVNDFVYGNIAGLAMLGIDPNEWFSESDMDKAATAFHFRKPSDRNALWERLAEPLSVLDTCSQVQFDLLLKGEISRDLTGGTVFDVGFIGAAIGIRWSLRDVLFHQCNFERVRFDFSRIDGTGFVACKFTDCEWIGAPRANEAWFSHDCVEYGGNLLESSRKSAVACCDSASTPSVNFRRVVLEQFWPPGRPHARPILQVRTLYQGVAAGDVTSLDEAIKGLRQEGILIGKDRLIEMDFGRMGEIRQILGR